MKTTKTFAALASLVTLALALASCSNATSGNSSAVAVNKSNAATVVNSSQTAVNNPTAAANTIASPTANAANKTSANAAANKNSNAAPAEKFAAETVQGELQIGRTESLILYVGMDSGDYAAYCFPNDSDTGRAILAACKDKQQCRVRAVVGEGTCQVSGLEATLSASGRLTKVESVKALGKK